MQALTFHHKHDIHFESIPDPDILAAGDAIVKVSHCAICGSDLHVYHAHEQGLDAGTAMGHEFCGEVVEVGTAVKNLKKGDRVMSPFTSSCGQCFYCKKGLTCRCEQGQLFGWVEKGKGLHGGQAEFVRVPLADGTLVKIPAGMSDELALLLGDILSTGYFCADQAGIRPDETQVVLGCGPVGLMSIWAAQKLGAERLYAIDQVPERLAEAERWGAIPINFAHTDPVALIREQTEGRGADAVLEAVGQERSNRLAFDLLRPGGIFSAVGVCTHEHTVFSPVEAYNKNLTYKIGRCPARFYLDKLLAAAQEDAILLSSVFTHRFKLSEGAKAYELFANKQDGCVKVILEM
jgi:threonine dehydrogenase-like Zn-dependent dehydrogenase